MFSKNAKLYLLCGKEGQLLKTEVNRLKTNAQALVTQSYNCCELALPLHQYPPRDRHPLWSTVIPYFRPHDIHLMACWHRLCHKIHQLPDAFFFLEKVNIIRVSIDHSSTFSSGSRWTQDRHALLLCSWPWPSLPVLVYTILLLLLNKCREADFSYLRQIYCGLSVGPLHRTYPGNLWRKKNRTVQFSILDVFNSRRSRPLYLYKINTVVSNYRLN